LNEQAAPVQPSGFGAVEADDPEELIAEQDAVRRTMAKLPEPLRVVLLLSIVSGLSTGEIADLLELKEAAVRQRLSRARKQFQQVYTQESGETVFDGADPAHPTHEDCVEPQTLNDKSRRFSFTTRSSTTRRSYA
jgi:hypothetical protein